MTALAKPYRRLPGRFARFLRHDTLWLGPDHLLEVRVRGDTEQYKRFYYGDIQALIVRKTLNGLIFNLIWGLLALFFLGLEVYYQFEEGEPIFWGIPTGGFLIGLLVNALFGPTCACQIQTAVQTDKLPTLSRLRTARKALERIRPAVEAIQGTVNPDEMNQAAVLAPPPPSRPAVAPGLVHYLLFTFLLLDGLWALLHLRYSHLALTMLGVGTSLALTVLVVLALVKQYSGGLDRSLVTVTWAAAIYTGLTLLGGYVIFIVVAVQYPNAHNNLWEQLSIASTLTPKDSQALLGMWLFLLAFSVSLAVLGIRRLRAVRLMASGPAISGGGPPPLTAFSGPPDPPVL